MRKLFYGIAFLGMSIPVVAYALNVEDFGAYAKFGEQMTELQKHFGELQEIKGQVTDQMKAIGKAGSLAVPLLNLTKVEGQLRKSVECSLLNEDDLKRMIPNLNFEELDFSSVCQAKHIYRSALFPTKEEYKKAETAQQQYTLGSEVRSRRTVMVVDTSTKALALADVTLMNSKDFNDAINELESAADSAGDTNSRLAVIAKGQALVAKGISQTNQLLAMMLKQQTATSIRDLPLVEVEFEN